MRSPYTADGVSFLLARSLTVAATVEAMVETRVAATVEATVETTVAATVEATVEARVETTVTAMVEAMVEATVAADGGAGLSSLRGLLPESN